MPIPCVIFDLDGTLLKSPTPTTEHNLDFWVEYWSDRSGALQRPNPEMVELLKLIVSQGLSVVILTARPAIYATDTITLLKSLGIFACQSIPWDIANHPLPGVSLVMWNVDPAFVDWSKSGDWKKSVVRALKIYGVRILFAIEDHKPNADILRQEVPVLLYESRRV